MKKIILLFIAIAGFICANAQDYIYTTSGELVLANITEVNSTEILFKRHNNPNGPQYRLPRNQIVLIEYQNGTIEKFTVGDYVEKQPADSMPVQSKYGKNLIGVNLLNIALSNAHVWYERIFTPRFGARLSINTHLGPFNGNDYTWVDYSFTTGADLNFYPTGQGRVRYYFGPGFRAGRLREISALNKYDFIYNYRAVFINNGVNFQATRNLFIGAQLGMGLQRVTLHEAVAGKREDSDTFTDLDGYLMLNLGWRF